MKRDIRIPDEAGMTDRETIIKGLEWWTKHQEGEVLPLAYSAVVETLKVLKEQEAVEPVKLVRCKNCKHCDSERIDKNMIWCKIHQFGRPDDYYCADGIEK